MQKMSEIEELNKKNTILEIEIKLLKRKIELLEENINNIINKVNSHTHSYRDCSTPNSYSYDPNTDEIEYKIEKITEYS